MTRRLDDDEKLTSHFGGSGQNREMIIISESGLYNAIIGSKKPEAKAFKKWITSVVIPSIRKHGGYLLDQENLSTEEILARAVLLSDSVIKEKQKKIELLKTKIEIDQPKVEFYDELASCDNAISIAATAKAIGIANIGRNTLFDILRKKHILDKENQPYQKYIDMKWFRVLVTKYNVSDSVKITTKTLVFPKGVEKIRQVVINYCIENNLTTLLKKAGIYN